MTITQKKELHTSEIMTLITNADRVTHKAAETTSKLREQLRAAEQIESKAHQKTGYLLRVIKMAGYQIGEGKEDKRWKWGLSSEHGPSSYGKTAWRKIWQLDSVLYTFYVSIKERTDLKRDKFEVSVSGSKDEIADVYYKGGYRDNHYIENHYEGKGDVLERKFKSLEEALTFAEGWKARLLSDHRAELDYERELAAKATPEDIAYVNDRRYY